MRRLIVILFGVLAVGWVGLFMAPRLSGPTEVAVADLSVFDAVYGVIAIKDEVDPSTMIIEEDVPILTRDGTRLSAKLHRPVTDAPVSVVMSFCRLSQRCRAEWHVLSGHFAMGCRLRHSTILSESDYPVAGAIR